MSIKDLPNFIDRLLVVLSATVNYINIIVPCLIAAWVLSIRRAKRQRADFLRNPICDWSSIKNVYRRTGSANALTFAWLDLWMPRRRQLVIGNAIDRAAFSIIQFLDLSGCEGWICVERRTLR